MSCFWVASQSYSAAPQRRETTVNLEDDATIAAGWISPWLDSNVKHCARWLRDKPSTVDLDSNHFAILDRKAIDGVVTICRIGDERFQGDLLSFQWRSSTMSAIFLAGLEAGPWETFQSASKGAVYVPSAGERIRSKL